MQFKNIFLLLAFATFFQLAFSQENNKAKKHEYELYFHWGYNRSRYTKSDIHLKGQGYDFTLADVKAKDAPDKFTVDGYINPLNITIPQFNFRLGVRIDKKWSISGGWDHLKYRVVGGQTVKMNGRIDAAASQQYAGNYNNQDQVLNFDFFRMEHTDGLNFVHLNLDRHFVLYQTPSNWFKAELLAGVGTGPVTPWTDTRLFNTFYRNPSIHFAGWGIAVNGSPRLSVKDRFFVETLFRVGYINLWDVMIERDKQKAKQQIGYFERNITVGFIFPLNKKRKEAPANQ